MKRPAEGDERQPPMPVFEWHRWFAWHPVLLRVDGELHLAWLQTVERMTNRYGSITKWRYRLPPRSCR
jgi:hypothetical protein